MRLWSIHPKYLDSRGLVAVWREGLLAKAVLEEKTIGYTKHPQLNRFKSHSNPIKAIGVYLNFIADEAELRGYNFNRKKLPIKFSIEKISVTSGQLEYEFKHLNRKLKTRDKIKFRENKQIKSIEPHPFFELTLGDVAEWEKTLK